MSEKLYAWLLRLYPSHFRETYGDESLQLFRDRARDEKGFFQRLRLWLDLLLDATISLPREYFHVPSPRVAATPSERLQGVPSFYVLQDESVRPSALLFGGVLSLAALGTCWVSLNQVHRGANSESFQFAAAQNDRGSGRAESAQPAPRAAAFASGPAALQARAMDAAERKRILAVTIANLREHYVDRTTAQKMADALALHEKRGDYNAVTDRAAFAALLTEQMREINPDRHLTLDYFQDPLPQQAVAQTPEVLAQYRETMKQQNCTFEKLEILPRNIGYVKLNSFPDPDICRVPAMAAMTYVNHADAIIFDLRDNRGGEPAMVQFLAAYLFDHPEYWYNPRENTTEQSWTRSPVPGNDLADKPVYVLTSPTTFSGAEQFCYDLKMLKRATLVGETTGGGAHSGVFHRIDDHFGMGIPEVKAINPYSSADWAEVGVEPDVRVPAATALDVALKLARAKLQKR
jgi:Peptidase family S41/N-terminal domain of Peptidase_S41 in eukaryotic IRBP